MSNLEIQTSSCDFEPSMEDFRDNILVPWFLTSFTEEILGIIGSRVGLKSVFRLFISGSSLLRQKLSSRRCRLELHYVPPGGLKVTHLPPFLLGLKGVAGLFVDHDKNGRSDAPTTDLRSMLPDSLESFGYVSDDGFHGVLNALIPEQKEIQPSAIQSLSLRSSKHPFLQNDLDLLGSGRFSNLCHLILDYHSLRIMHSLPSLPTSLESLTLDFCGSLPYESITRLTRLQKLIVPHLDYLPRPLLHGKDIASYPPLPPLRELDIRHCKNGAVVTDFFDQLPLLTLLAVHCKILEKIAPLANQKDANASSPAFWDQLTHLVVEGNLEKIFRFPSRLSLLQMTPPGTGSPGLLPKTLRTLIIPHTQHIISILPQKLTKLEFDPSFLSQLPSSRNSHLKLPPLPFPPSLTHIACSHHVYANAHPKAIVEAEHYFVARLPDTVILYEAKRIYQRMPEWLRLEGDKARIRGSNFFSLESAISADATRLASYILENRSENYLKEFGWEHFLIRAIEAEAKKSILWICKQIRQYCSSLFDSIASRPYSNVLQALILHHCELKIPKMLVEGGFPGRIFQNDRFVLDAVKLGNIELLRLMDQCGVCKWYPSIGSSLTLMLAMDSPEITTFLLEHGARSINIPFFIDKCLQSQNLAPLELICDLHKRYNLVNRFPLLEISKSILWNANNPMLILDIIVLLASVNVVVMQPSWLQIIFRQLYGLLMARIHFKSQGRSYNTFSYDVESSINLTTFTQCDFTEEELDKIRKFDEDELISPSQLSVLCQRFTMVGMDIFAWSELGGTTLIDVALILNSLELLTFLSLAPNHSFLKALQHYSKFTTYSATEAHIIQHVLVPRAWGFHCSPEIFDFLRRLSAPLKRPAPAKQSYQQQNIVSHFLYSEEDSDSEQSDEPYQNEEGAKKEEDFKEMGSQPAPSKRAYPATFTKYSSSKATPPPSTTNQDTSTQTKSPFSFGKSPFSLGSGYKFGSGSKSTASHSPGATDPRPSSSSQPI